MSLESISVMADLTGMDRRTVKNRLKPMNPVIEGRSHLYETKDALPLLYLGAEKAKYDLQEERARLSHHQANLEKIKEDEARGRIMQTDLVVMLCSGLASTVRSKLLGVPSAVKTKNGKLDQKIVNDIERLIHEALSELGNDGIPTELRKRVERYRKDLQATAEADD